jgi:hypothetical protein
MVNKAKEETAQTNKLLNEAKGKIIILEAELNALKMLIVNFNSNESKYASPSNFHRPHNKQHKRAFSHSTSFTSPIMHQSISTPDSLSDQAEPSAPEVCPRASASQAGSQLIYSLFWL